MVKQSCLLVLLIVLAGFNTQVLAANEKIIYHIHSSDPQIWQRAINNLENLIDGMPDDRLDIRLLLQGESIQLLNPNMQSGDIGQSLSKLQNRGVNIEVTTENFRKNNQFLDNPSPPTQVQNIFSRIIELQKSGYHYITP